MHSNTADPIPCYTSSRNVSVEIDFVWNLRDSSVVVCAHQGEGLQKEREPCHVCQGVATSALGL